MTEDLFRWLMAPAVSPAVSRGLGRLLVGAALLGPSAASPEAVASGFDAPSIGSGQSSPVARRSSAVHYNPGQLGFIDRTEVELGAGLIFGSIGYQRERLGQYQYADNFDFSDPVDPVDIDPSRTGPTEAVRATPVGPSVDIFTAVPLHERFTLGAGFYVPYAAILSLPEDGAQRFQAQSITLISTSATVSGGVKLHDVISVGLGVSYVLSIMQLSKVQDFADVGAFGDGLASAPINQPNSFGPGAPASVRELDLLARQADIGPAWSHGFSFNAGVALRPTKKLDLALVYQHGSRVRLRGPFTLNMDDEFFTQDLAAQGLEFPPLVEGDAEIELSLPKRLTLGAGYRINPKLSIDGAFSYVFYSDFDKVDITLRSPQLAQPALGIGDAVPQDLVRNWNNTVHAELNLRGQATDKLLLSGTLGYQSSASPDSTVDMASPDGNRLLGGLGLEYTISDRWSVLGDVRLQGILPRTVTDSNYDLGNGTYKLFIGVAAIHARIRLGSGPKGKRKAKATVSSEAESSEESDAESTEAESSEESDVESTEATEPTDESAGPLPPPPPPPPA